jgi:predicted amidophosphoribosyltransferase
MPPIEEVVQLARRKRCPRCDLDKTIGTGLCRKCRSMLPANMRRDIETIADRDPYFVMRAMRAAANYLHVHFQSVRNFGGGKKR